MILFNSDHNLMLMMLKPWLKVRCMILFFVFTPSCVLMIYCYILTCVLIFPLTSSSFVGTLEGFSFDSEDDVDDLPKATLPANQNGDAEEQPNGKNKQRSQKPSVCCLAVYLIFLFHIHF